MRPGPWVGHTADPFSCFRASQIVVFDYHVIVRVRKMSDRFSCKHADALNGGEDGDNSSPGNDVHESELKPQLGTDGESDVSHDAFGDECELPLELEGILERFDQATRLRLREPTRRTYSIVFRRFWLEMKLDGVTKRQLSTKRGRDELLSFLAAIPKPSLRTVISAIASVWKNGIGLPWPVDSKGDLPRLPRVRRRSTPSDGIVRKWHEAVRREPDVYLRLEWLMLAQHGWRPQHLCKVKWKYVLRDERGRPYALIADGSEEEFKTHASIASRLCPEVVETLAEWEKLVPDASPDGPILPFRDRARRLSVGTEQSSENVRAQWRRLQEKHSLPLLLPCHMRHFVSTACRRAGLSKQATAYLQGHDPTQGGSMRDWYDAPLVEDALDEQAERIPNGPLGVIESPEIEVTDGLPKEVSAMVSQFLDGSTGTLELMNALEKCRVNIQKASQPGLER